MICYTQADKRPLHLEEKERNMSRDIWTGEASPSARVRGGRKKHKTPTHQAPSSHDGEKQPTWPKQHSVPSPLEAHRYATIPARKKRHTVRTVPGYVSRTWEIVWELEKKREGGEAGHPRRAREGGARGWFITIAALTIKEGGKEGSEGGKTEVVKGGWVFMAHPPIPPRAPSLATVISFLFWYSA